MELTQHQPGIFVLSLTDAENRFNPTFMANVHAALDQVDRYDGAAVLITRASGKIFSNGLDLQWLGEHADQRDTFLCSFMRLIDRILVAPYRTIAAIQGHAFAGGMIFALAHDNRVMRRDRGFLCMPEVRAQCAMSLLPLLAANRVRLRLVRDLNLPLAPGMNAIVASKVSSAQILRDVILDGKRYGGEAALAAGLVDVLADTEEQVFEHALQLALQLLPKSQHRITLQMLKLEMYHDAHRWLTSDVLFRHEQTATATTAKTKAKL